MRCFVIVACLFLAMPSVSRGDDAADRSRKVRVALALATADAKTERAVAQPAAAPVTDWLVAGLSDAKREEPAAPRKVEPTRPAKELWQLWDGAGRTWYEWRDPAPRVMPGRAGET